jgi:hypothetical protein
MNKEKKDWRLRSAIRLPPPRSDFKEDVDWWWMRQPNADALHLHCGPITRKNQGTIGPQCVHSASIFFNFFYIEPPIVSSLIICIFEIYGRLN